MSAAELIESAVIDGVRLALTNDGRLHYRGDANVIAQWLPVIRDNKLSIVSELHREGRRTKVLALLESAPDTRYAVYVGDASTDPVVVSVAIRDITTFELEIPHKFYDGMQLLELIEKLSGEHNANT